jgi:type IV secretion system protein VirB6
VGANDFVTIVDTILFQGDDVATALLAKAGILHGNFSFYLAALAVYVVIGITALYTMFLLTLSRIALSVLLAIGPLIIPLFLFQSTRRFVEAWFAQLATYAFVAVLAGLIAALMMHLIEQAAAQAQAAGGGIQIAQAVRVCIAAGFTFLVMRQVLPMAGGLASGVALSTFGIVSGALTNVRRRTLFSAGQFARGALMDRETTRWDPLSRKAGYWLTAKVRTAWRRDNSIKS